MIQQWNLVATCVLGPLVGFLKVNVHTASFQAYSQPCTFHLWGDEFFSPATLCLKDF